MKKAKKIRIIINSADDVIFKVGNSKKVEISKNKNGTYHCFLLTSPHRGFGGDCETYDEAESIAVEYTASIYNYNVYFEKVVNY